MSYTVFLFLLFIFFGGFTSNMEKLGKALGKALIAGFILVILYRFAAERKMIPADLHRIIEQTVLEVKRLFGGSGQS